MDEAATAEIRDVPARDAALESAAVPDDRAALAEIQQSVEEVNTSSVALPAAEIAEIAEPSTGVGSYVGYCKPVNAVGCCCGKSDGIHKFESGRYLQRKDCGNCLDDSMAGKELPGYFTSYHQDFIPRYQDSVVAWQENRRRVIGNAQAIRLAHGLHSSRGD